MEAATRSGRTAGWFLFPATGDENGPAPLLRQLAALGPVIVQPLPERIADLGDLAAAMVAALDRAELARTVVVGLSFGGQVAQALLQHHPQRVAGLLLVGSGAPDRARALALARTRWWWRFLPARRRAPRERLLVSDRDGAAAVGAFAGFAGPVELIELGADRVISAAERARLRALFPQARCHVVAGLDHAALLAWPPELAAACAPLLAALASTAVSGAARAGSS